TPLQDYFSSIYDSRIFLLPIPIKFFKLRQAGELSHTVQKDFSNQVIQLMLDTDPKQTGRFKIYRGARAIQGLDTDHRRARHFAAQTIDAEAALPVLRLLWAIKDN